MQIASRYVVLEHAFPFVKHVYAVLEQGGVTNRDMLLNARDYMVCILWKEHFSLRPFKWLIGRL
jgi:hypothetical protein